MKYLPEGFLIAGFVIFTTSSYFQWGAPIAGLIAGGYISMLSLLLANNRQS